MTKFVTLVLFELLGLDPTPEPVKQSQVLATVSFRKTEECQRDVPYVVCHCNLCLYGVLV